MDYHSYALFSFLVVSGLILLIFLLHKHYSTSTPQVEPPDPEDHSEIIPDTLGEEEKELIRNIIEFQDVIVHEVMMPRIDILAVEEATSLREFRLLAQEKGHSRIPVYRETVDHIVGIAYVKDILSYWEADENAITVADFLRPPYFVPETKNIGSLLHEFQAKKVHMAVAIDEYGGTAGIVTIEDILEEIFGDIVDEHDDEEEELITVINEHTIEVDAKADIDDVEDHVGKISVEQHDFETVSGLLFTLFGEIPKEQETVEHHNLRFTILKADRHRILRVRIEQMPEATNVNSLEK